jgi:hypothetical protein
MRIKLLAFALLALALFSPPFGRAQVVGSVPGTLAGTWASEASAARAMAIVDAAFEPGVAALPYFFQSIARNRIHASMQPANRVVVTLTGSRVRVVYTSDVTKIIDGTLGTEASVSGLEEGTRVSTSLSGGWLQLVYAGEGGMTQLLSTEPDGTRMHLDCTVTSERLPEPVRWRLDYVRTGS